jgi:hypothetical protein
MRVWMILASGLLLVNRWSPVPEQKDQRWIAWRKGELAACSCDRETGNSLLGYSAKITDKERDQLAKKCDQMCKHEAAPRTRGQTP